MIGRLRGRTEMAADGKLLIDVGGVGYLLSCSRRCLEASLAQEEAELLVETHIRDDRIELYGFSSRPTALAFSVLTGVQGVGARLALAILGVLSPDQLARAIAGKDIASLTRAPGLGRKLATRLINEIGDKLWPLSGPQEAPPPGTAEGHDGARLANDATEALIHLGVGRDEARAAVARALTTAGRQQMDLASLLRLSLKEIAQ